MAEIKIIFPKRSEDQLSEALVELTRQICLRDPEADGGYGFGGPFGYGEHIDTPVFTMRKFYWGDCDCGSDERDENWLKANPHAPTCFRTAMDMRMRAYDVESGYQRIHDLAFKGDDGLLAGMNVEAEQEGPVTFFSFEPREDAAMNAYRKAAEARDKYEESFAHTLCGLRGLKWDNTWRWRCTCGQQERMQRAAENGEVGHLPTCSHELPNFLFKPTGFEVRWYKYIGRGMEMRGDSPDINGMLRACVESIPDPERTQPDTHPPANLEQTNLNPETPQASSGKEGGLLGRDRNDRNSHESGKHIASPKEDGP